MSLRRSDEVRLWEAARRAWERRDPATGLGGAARQRAIERALSAATAPARVGRGARSGKSAGALAAAVAVVAGLGGVTFAALLARSHPNEVKTSVSPSPTVARVTLQPGALARIAPLALTAVEASTFAWDPGTSTLRVESGRVRVHVEPGEHAFIAVAPASLRVDVAGSDFDVFPTRVAVVEGHLRLTSAAGAPVVADLGPGASWSLDGAPVPPAADAPSRQPPIAEAPAAAMPVDPPPAVRLSAPAEIASPRPNASALERLLRARRRLADHDVDAARALVSSALQAPTPAPVRAEAYTLRAECALVEGQVDRATQEYLEVADRFRGLPAAEDALFAAARAQANAGRSVRAQALLRAYVDRYPTGRFRLEADERMRAAGAPPP